MFDRREGGTGRGLATLGAAVCVVRTLLFLVCASLAGPGSARAEEVPLRVATFVLPPYVMKQGDGLTGFSVDIWRAVAERMHASFTFVEAPDVDGLMADIRSGSADIGVSGVFITEERDESVDFSVPILNAGLQVMTPDERRPGSFVAVGSLASVIFSATTLEWLAFAVLLMLVPAHIVWWLEREKPDSITAGGRYWPGILASIHWSMSTLLTQSEASPRGPAARALALLWMFVGTMFVALYTADLTASLTVQQIRGVINGPEDLPHRAVATLKGSTSAAYLRDHDALVQEYPDTDAMIAALRDGAEAVLFSAPTLRYYAAHGGSGRVRLVGPEFDKGDLGFVVPVDSPLRRRVDAALLALRDDGTYQRLHKKWFGSAG